MQGSKTMIASLIVGLLGFLWLLAASVSLITVSPVINGLIGLVGIAAWVWPAKKVLETRYSDYYLKALIARNQEHEDLRQVIPEDVVKKDPIAQQINQSLSKTSEILYYLLDHNLHSAVISAKGRQLSETSHASAKQQAELADEIFQTSDETTKALNELTERTATIAESNSHNLEIASQAQAELESVLKDIETSSSVLGDFSETVDQLVKNSESIGAILETVQGFADQTNMLALNAAIEAARAGEHGRGFAVVADEVRTLASKVGTSADQINHLVGEMSNIVSKTSQSNRSANDSTHSAKESVNNTMAQFQTMVHKFEMTHESLLMVSSTAEELALTNKEGLKYTKEIQGLGEKILNNMDKFLQQADVMKNDNNESLKRLSQIRLQDGPLEPLILELQNRTAIMKQALCELIEDGVDVFDRNYSKIEGTKMNRHEVSWGEAFRNKMQSTIDRWHHEEAVQGVLYWLPTDDRGYLPINKSEASKPETGDLKTDMVYSRSKLFSVGSKFDLENINSCKYVGMGSFVIPGGQVVISLFIPIDIDGRRWGTLGLGTLPQTLGINVD